MLLDAGEWVLLAYRLPREPSTPRIALWRRLRRLGVAQVLDGLVALPLDRRTQEQLEWLADEVVEAGGSASVWLARPDSRGQQRALVTEMTDAVVVEYREVIRAAEEAKAEPPAVRARALRRLRRGLGLIHQRDYFPPPERERAQQAVEALAAAVGARP